MFSQSHHSKRVTLRKPGRIFLVLLVLTRRAQAEETNAWEYAIVTSSHALNTFLSTPHDTLIHGSTFKEDVLIDSDDNN